MGASGDGDTGMRRDVAHAGGTRGGSAPRTFLRGTAAEYAAPVVSALARLRGEGDPALLERVRAALHERYEIGREVGHGGMATVYQARDRRFERDVAIKVLREDGTRLASAERFAREIALVARLQHPHIVPLYDSGDSDGLHYFVMPYVRGESLRTRLQREPAILAADALACVRMLAAALDCAHAHGIVHRDVKPENILLLPDGHAMLADFGIALALDGDTAVQLTEPGGAPGTQRYMSPEQARGERELGPAADIYSLAAVARELLVGAAVAKRSASSERRPWLAPGDHGGDTGRALSPAVESVLARARAEDPARRHATAGEFAEALAAAYAGASSTPSRAASLVRVSLVAAVALTIVWLAPLAPPVSPSPSARIVAVLPLATKLPLALRDRGLGDALVQPLSMQLDASSQLRTVDHGAVLAASRGRSPSLTDARLARSLGATDYVTGSIVGIGGGRIAVFLTLRSVDSGTREPVAVEADGDADRLIELVHSLGRQLLVRLAPSSYREAASLAERTTRSDEALAAYLEGERHYRARRYDSATVLFNRAIEADSTFALAMHRLRVAYTATPIAIPGPRDLRQRTLRHAARLPERQRLLVLALDAFIAGEPFEAENLYKRVLATYPHDVEALQYLANLQIQYLANWGFPLDTPRTVLEHLLRIDPEHAGAVEKLAMIAAAQMRSTASESLLARLAPLEKGEYRLVTEAVHAFRRRDTAAQERALAALDRAPTPLVSMAAHRGGGVYPGHLAARIRMAELLTRPHRTPDQQARGHLMIADLELARGRLRAADAARAAAARISPDARLEGFLRAFVASPAFEQRTLAEIAEARSSVSAALDAGARDSVQQRFLLGVLDARLANYRAASGHAAVLDRWSRRLAHDADSLARRDPDGSVARRRRSARLASLAGSIRADIERRRGTPARALDVLRDWHPERWWTFALHDAVRAQPYERRLHAEVLEATGHYEQAVRWYEVWHGPLITGTAYSTTARLRMARLLDRRLGRPVEARAAYLQVVDALRDADPELWGLREEARRAAARLAGDAAVAP